MRYTYRESQGLSKGHITDDKMILLRIMMGNSFYYNPPDCKFVENAKIVEHYCNPLDYTIQGYEIQGYETNANELPL